MICALEMSKHRVPKRVSLVLLIGGGRLGGNGDAAYSQCRIISISGLEVV